MIQNEEVPCREEGQRGGDVRSAGPEAIRQKRIGMHAERTVAAGAEKNVKGAMEPEGNADPSGQEFEPDK